MPRWKDWTGHRNGVESGRVLSVQDAKHPLLLIGAGANRKMTAKMLRQFVTNTGIPFCDTQMGKGVIDSREHLPNL